MLGKIRVGVFFGGKSIENEVSFNSGRTVCDHLDTELYEVIPVYQDFKGLLYILPWKFLHRGKISDFVHRLEKEATFVNWEDLKKLIDFAYIALHGRYGEDGRIQGMFEILNIPYLGSKVLSCALMMDKRIHSRVLKAHGIAVPDGIAIYPSEINNIDAILNKLSFKKIEFPLIVKPASEGSSLGVSVVSKKEDLLQAILHAAQCDFRIIQTVLIEEKVDGMEFVCTSIEDAFGNWRALPPTEIVLEKDTTFFDYEQKYMPGKAIKITPARCSEEQIKLIQETCVKATKILEGSIISRIDGFLTKKNEVVLIDPQPITGMSPSTMVFNQAAQINLSHTQFINYLIEIGLKKYGISLYKKIERDKKLDKKIRVAVLLGGDSYEKEISLESGRNICYKLSPNKYEVIPVFVDNEMQLHKLTQKLLVKNSTKAIAMGLTSDLKINWSELKQVCDFVFIALHGGKGEDGTIQGALEMLDLPYNGSSVLASSLCMNKYKTNDFLRANGFDTPFSMIIKKSDWEDCKNDYISLIEKQIKFPLVLKPHNDGCSNLVKKVNQIEALQQAIDDYFKFEKTMVMVEEFVKNAIELTCGVFGNDAVKALSVSQPAVAKDILSIEEKFLPGAGENQTPANLPATALKFVMSIMEDVYKVVGCKGYARIDCFYQESKFSPTGKARVIILEINTLPGITPATCLFHQAAEVGLKPMEFIDKVIELGFEKHKIQAPLDKKKSAFLIN